MFISGFSDERKKQLSLFDLSSGDDFDNDKLQNVIDEIRAKYGNKVIVYGCDKVDRR